MKARLVSLIAAILLLGSSVVPAQAAKSIPTPTPVSQPAKPPKPVKAPTRATPLTPAQMMAGMTTNADREAAAKRAAAKGVKPATQNIKSGAKANAAGAKAIAKAAALGQPDYFGIFPNYANSQLPTGPVVTITGGGATTDATAVATPGANGSIASLTLIDGGAGYTAIPTVTISGPGSGASATAAITTGAVSALAITAGAGYTTPVISFSGPGTGAAADPTGGVDNIILTTPGAHYTTPTVSFLGGGTPGVAIGAAATASGVVDGITPTAPGSGYSAPVVTLTGGGATTDATASATVVAGAITGFTIVTPGVGYTSAPTVTITDATGDGFAAATATISITAVAMNAQGSGYNFAPSVAFNDTTGSGTGAAATATINVTGAIITDPGSGYSTAPVVTIADTAPGTGAGASAIATVSGVVSGLTITGAGTGYVTGGIRKFVDTLPGLGSGQANDIGQYLPVASPDTTSFPNSDYIEIGLVQYREQLHKDLSPTLLRGYVQISTPNVPGLHLPLVNVALDGTTTPVLDRTGQQVYSVDKPSYLGPIIVAQKNHATRIKFTNFLPTGQGGNLFIPTDTTDMGAGMGPVQATDGTTSCDPMMETTCASYTENRATLHLHGGFTPWISDGTTHQWTTPAGETTPYPRGVSVSFVPDMWFDANGNQVPAGTPGASNDPGPGSLTFYYTNQQSARLMFYHDHAYGITRLNVYAGEAAGFVLQDPVLDSTLNCTVLGACSTVATSLVSRGIVPSTQIPLVIQDKTFVPDSAQLAAEDPTWDLANYGSAGNLWFPHVYMPNQNPSDQSGANAMGRWDYGPWFWPPYQGLANGPVANPLCNPGCPGAENPQNPGTPNPSLVPESFMDTPLVNGTVYPVLNVTPKAYRFSILNAGNDRNINLSLWQSAASFGGSTATSMWNTNGTLADPNFGEVPMVPAVAGTPGTAGYASPDQTDGRAGGVPDVRAAGPAMVQIASEGGILPAPVVLSNTPVGYNYNRRDIVVLNVSNKTLFMGPAERADVIVDFSKFAGKTLILYNDSPAPVPAFDSRYDYYTGDPDQTSTGGAPTTLPGYGPNTRTIMQIVVSGGTPAPAFNVTTLKNAWSAAYAASQDKPIVPETAYNGPFPGTATADTYARITETSLWTGGPITGFHMLTGGTGYTSAPTVNIIGGNGTGAAAHAVLTAGVVTDIVVDNGGNGFNRAPVITLTGGGGTGATAVALGWHVMLPKAIQELFETQYGRMNATLGIELPFTSVLTQTTIPLGYAEPTTEDISPSDLLTPVGSAADGSQIWKITHNGVDTHTIHFHLFNVQVINRVGWDGAIRPPDANELGWKESVRMNPLEDAIIAIRPTIPVLPFKVPDSQRPIDVTRPTTASIATFDPITGNAVNVVNAIADFGWEYVWHCHLLGHEENDMMRPIAYNVSPAVPTALAAVNETFPAAVPPTQDVKLDWAHTSAVYPVTTNFVVRRATDAAFTQNVTMFGVQPTPQTPPLITLKTFTDTTVANGTTYWYQVRSENSVGYSAWSDSATVTTAAGLNVTPAPLSVPFGTAVPLAFTPVFVSAPVAGILPSAALVAAVTCSSTYTPTSPIGTYPSICTGPASDTPNFLYVTYLPGTVTVTAAPVVVTGLVTSVPYGSAVPALTPTYSPVVTPATAPTCTTLYTPTSPVGSYPVTCSGAADPRYTFTYVAGSITVTPVALTVTAPSPTMAFGALALPALTPVITGFVTPDTIASLPTPPTCTTTAVVGSNVGTYPVTCAGGVATNYTFTYVSGTLTVTAATLTITASSASMVYGGVVPAITPAYAGFVNGNTAASLTTAPTCSTTATPASPAGTYPSSCSGAASPNYIIVYVNGTVTVSAAPLTITASSGTMVFGGTPPTITASFLGFVNGDSQASLAGTLTCSTTATSTSSVAGSPYSSSCTGLTSTNYTITYVPGTVTVTPVALVITASSGTMVYGSTPPVITPSYAGLAAGNLAPATPPTCSTVATSASPVGVYASTCSGAIDPNYTISYVAGVVNVTQAALAIVPPSGTMVYGGPVISMAPTYVGFVNGDTVLSLTSPAVCAPVITAATPVGTYLVGCSGATSPNYVFVYLGPSVVTVTPAAVTVTASSPTMVYGGAVPAITPTYAGLKNGATSPATSPTCSTTATSVSPVGTYPSTCSGAADPNYTFTYVAGTVTVTKAAVTTVVTSTVNPSVHGQSVTFRATVTRSSAGAGAVPSGTVQFTVDGVNLGGARTLSAAGVATSIATTTLTTATHSVVATYSGDVRYLGGASAPLSQVVRAAATATTLTLVTPVSRATTIRYTARVRSVAPGTGTPTGTVRFYRGATLIGSATLAGGVAVLNYRNTTLALGTYSMHAIYVASTNFLTSTSPNVSQRITR